MITEVTVRLRARPERDETIAISLPANDDLDSWLAKVRALPFTSLAAEMVNASLASALGAGDRPLLLARLGGNDDAVRAQRQLIGAFGDAVSAPPDIWRALAEIEPPGAAVARVSAPPSRLHALWNRLASDEDALVHATVGRGIVRTIRLSSSAAAPWLERIALCEGTHIFERLPAESWGDIPSRVSDPLSRAVRGAFDPAGVLNRGILGDIA
ncbi:MAG: hypothetical protein ACHQRL_10115 [Gemmatimonadales bacterium]